MPDKKFCTNCGAELPSAAKFCAQCGKSISSLGEDQPSAVSFWPSELINELPHRLEKVLLELLDPNENVHIKLKGAFKEALVCTDKRVIILKAGFMTGQTFGSNVFQATYRNITGVQVKKHMLTGYFEVSGGGVQSRPTSYWNTGLNGAEKRENCISLNTPESFRKFREASSFILSRCH